MTSAPPRRRNPYRPGTAKYAKLRAADLKKKAAVAQKTAARAKSPQARARAKRQVSAAHRALTQIKTREEYRSKLNEAHRASFDRLSIKQQKQLIEVRRVYPDSVPKDLPDPFVGPNRETLWRLSYSTRAGIRQKARS